MLQAHCEILVTQAVSEIFQEELIECFAKYLLEIADRLAEDVQPLKQPIQNNFLDRVLGDEANNMDAIRCLTKSIDATDALLNLHRIPRQVVVDQHPGELKIDTFAADLGRDQNGGAIRISESS